MLAQRFLWLIRFVVFISCFWKKKTTEFITNDLKYVWFKNVMIEILWICFVLFCFWSTICPFCGSKLIVVMFFSKPYYYKGSFVFLRLEFFMGARRRPTRASGTRSKPRQRGGRELVSHHGLDSSRWCAPNVQGAGGRLLPLLSGRRSPPSCPPTGLASGSRWVTAGACRSLHPALPVAGRPHASSHPGETFLSSQSRRANISPRALPWVMSKVGTLRRDLWGWPGAPCPLSSHAALPARPLWPSAPHTGPLSSHPRPWHQLFLHASWTPLPHSLLSRASASLAALGTFCWCRRSTLRPHLSHTWARPSSSLLLKPLRALCYQGLRLLYLQGPTHMPGRKWRGRYPPDAIKIIRVCAQSCVQNPMLIFCGRRNKWPQARGLEANGKPFSHSSRSQESKLILPELKSRCLFPLLGENPFFVFSRSWSLSSSSTCGCATPPCPHGLVPLPPCQTSTCLPS